MSTRALRLGVALGAVVFALLAALAPAAVASPASAADGSASCELAEPTDDDVISILGRICDRRESPQAPVEGVTFTVEDDAGEVIGEATSGPDGTFVIDLPGAAIENLGKQFIGQARHRVHAPGGHRARGAHAHGLGQPRHGPVRDVPDRGGGPRRHGLLHRGSPADHRRDRLLRPPRDGGARAVDDLRHHRPDQLRPWRARDVRRPGGVRRRPAARCHRDRRRQRHPHDRRGRGVRGRRRVRLAQRRRPLEARCATGEAAWSR